MAADPDRNMAVIDERGDSASAPPSPSSRPRARVLAVTSGKGGVGKTFVTTNLAAGLAQQGLRVLVLDADLGLANLDVVLNLSPRVTLHDVIVGRAPLREAIHDAPGGFAALLAGSGMIEYSRLTLKVRDELARITAQLAQEYDVVLLDTGAGISDVVLYTVSLADEVLLVATPEPTSLTDAYATIKVLATCQPSRPLRLVVNQVLRRGEAVTVGQQLQRVVDRYMNPAAAAAGLAPLQLPVIGEVPVDEAVRDAVRRRELLLASRPGAAAAQAIGALAGRVARSLGRSAR